MKAVAARSVSIRTPALNRNTKLLDDDGDLVNLRRMRCRSSLVKEMLSNPREAMSNAYCATSITVGGNTHYSPFELKAEWVVLVNGWLTNGLPINQVSEGWMRTCSGFAPRAYSWAKSPMRLHHVCSRFHRGWKTGALHPCAPATFWR